MGKWINLAYKDHNELIFGEAVYPVECGFGVRIGARQVYPEINYTLPTMEITKETFPEVRRQYQEMATDVLTRALELEVPGLVIEIEHLPAVTQNPEWCRIITEETKSIMSHFYSKYGFKSALRATVIDLRDMSRPPLLRRGENLEKVLQAFRECSVGGADILSIESTGGKEVFDKAVLEGDIIGVLFSVGVLGSRDMEFLWHYIVEICKEHKVVPGGDTDCAHANTAMVLANKRYLPHTFAAVVRAIGAVRSLVAYEQGAIGPAKDCGYENPIIKVITGVPISMEGKSSACAHFSYLGNIAMAVCDLWSNESVQNIKLLAGYAPAVFTEILAYDCHLMNEAINAGRATQLRDLLVNSDKYRNPQAFLLAPDNVFKLAEAIIAEENYYSRALKAAILACSLLKNAYAEKKLKLSEKELKWLDRIQSELESLPEEEEKFIANAVGLYKEDFLPEEYGLKD